jgi:hypothetical protein
MNNGTRKGGEPETMMSVHTIPGFEDLWQLHFSLLSGQEYTQPGQFIANLPDEPPAAIPIAPMAAPVPGTTAPPPPTAQRTGVLDQALSTAGRHVHRHKRAQQVQQDVRGENGDKLAGADDIRSEGSLHSNLLRSLSEPRRSGRTALAHRRPSASCWQVLDLRDLGKVAANKRHAPRLVG